MSIDGAFSSVIPKLPEVSVHNSTQVYQKGQKSSFFGEKMLSGNSEVAFLPGGA